MARRPIQRSGRRRSVAGLFVLGAGVTAFGQGSRASAPLSVSATVVQTCTVEQVRAPALPGSSSPGATGVGPGPSYTVRCGKQLLTYPASAGQATPLSQGAPVTIARTPDGRTFIVQF